MKHIRLIAPALALVLMLGLFSACGKAPSAQQSASSSQPDAGISMPEADLSAPEVSQPEEETPAPEVKPEEKPAAPAPEAKPEEKPAAPAPEVKPEEKPAAPAPEVKPEEQPETPAPEAKPEEQPSAPAKVDLAAFYQSIFTDPENAPAMMPMENDALDAFYPGLTALTLAQKAAYMPMITAVPCEIVMVECTNAVDVETVKTLFKTRIDSQVNNHFNYPMVIEAWEKEAKVVSNGNFVALLLVSGMTDQVVANFNALF